MIVPRSQLRRPKGLALITRWTDATDEHLVKDWQTLRLIGKPARL